MNKKQNIGLLTILAMLLCTSGMTCRNETGPITPERAESKARAIAFGAAQAILNNNPDYRLQFQQASTDLKVLASQPEIRIADITAIFGRLPTKELKNQNLEIIVKTTFLLLEDELGTWKLESPELVKAGVIGIAKGIDLAAGVPPVPPTP